MSAVHCSSDRTTPGIVNDGILATATLSPALCNLPFVLSQFFQPLQHSLNLTCNLKDEGLTMLPGISAITLSLIP